MEKNYYNINELAVISGFTTRSLRNFITMGHLKGEKLMESGSLHMKKLTSSFQIRTLCPE